MTDLFELLDVDGSGRLTRGEFVEGLLNLVLMDVARLFFFPVLGCRGLDSQGLQGFRVCMGLRFRDLGHERGSHGSVCGRYVQGVERCVRWTSPG